PRWPAPNTTAGGAYVSAHRGVSDGQSRGAFQGCGGCVRPSVPGDYRALCQARRGDLGVGRPAMARRWGMNADRLWEYLDAYLGVRQAVGFQMRAHRTLLRDFVQFVTRHGDDGRGRAQHAVDWAGDR